jgi:toxin YhaV
MAPRGRKPGSTGGQSAPDPPPVVRNGWQIYVWGEFRQTWTRLRAEVARLEASDPANYKRHPTTIFLRDLRDIVLSQVPANPDDKRYRLGTTLGPAYRHWRRVKFRGRFRLFFRYSSKHKAIFFVWLNDEKTLRKDGSRTDVYAVFRTMLERKQPPTDWANLIAACKKWLEPEIAE